VIDAEEAVEGDQLIEAEAIEAEATEDVDADEDADDQRKV
jgi:hypothetical protein